MNRYEVTEWRHTVMGHVAVDVVSLEIGPVDSDYSIASVEHLPAGLLRSIHGDFFAEFLVDCDWMLAECTLRTSGDLPFLFLSYDRAGSPVRVSRDSSRTRKAPVFDLIREMIAVALPGAVTL